MKSHEKQAIAIMLWAHQKPGWCYFMNPGFLATKVPASEKALIDAALRHLYSNGFGTRGKSDYDFSLSHQGAEYISELKLTDGDRLTQVGEALSVLYSTLTPAPQGDKSAQECIDEFKRKLWENPVIETAAKTVIWVEDSSISVRDYEKSSVALMKYMRKLADVVFENLEIPKSSNSSLNDSHVSMTIGNLNNFGFLNAGSMADIKQININAEAMKERHAEVGQSIKLLTESIQQAELPIETKERALDSINVLSTEIAKPSEERKSWKIAEHLQSLTKVLNAGTAVCEGYDKLKPHVDSALAAIKAAVGL